jgi:hypothetical protein
VTAQNSAKTARGGKRVIGRPFPKGKSGNPGGRPRGSGLLSKALRDLLAKPKVRDRYGRTHAEIVAAALIKQAEKGHVPAIRETGDRSEGRPYQAVELLGRDGSDLIPDELPAKVLKLLEMVAGHRKRK